MRRSEVVADRDEQKRQAVAFARLVVKLETENAARTKTIRKYAIQPVYALGTDELGYPYYYRSGQCCRECGGSWNDGEAEDHRGNCLASQEGTV